MTMPEYGMIVAVKADAAQQVR